MVYTLKELVKIKYGKNQKDVENPNGKYPIYGTGGLMSYADKYLYDKPSVLIGRKGSISKVRFSDKPFWTVDTLFYTEVNEDIVIPKYLYYKMLTMDMSDYNEGTTIPSLRTDTLYRIELDIPDKKRQQRVVKILEPLDNKIEINNEINNNLLELCNFLFHEYLDEYENKIEYKKIADIAKKVVTGKTPSTSNKDFWDGSIPFITIPDMHNQTFTIKTERNITELGAKSTIPKNSISVSCIATVGLVSINTEESQTNQQINSIILNNDYELYYLYEYLSEQEAFMKSIAGGSTTYNINKNTFENIEIPYLPNDVIIDFNDKVSGMFEKIKNNQYENEELSQLRDTLLLRLMNGEIDLDKIEI